MGTYSLINNYLSMKTKTNLISLENNARGIMKRDADRLEHEITTKRRILKHETIRLERLSSQITLSEQQIQLFSVEASCALEKMKDANW